MSKDDSSKSLLVKTPGKSGKKKNRTSSFLKTARDGNVETVRSRILAGASLNQSCKNGGTALFYAAESGHVGVVSALLLAGANTELRYKGKTVLGLAADEGNKEIVRMLLRYGVRPVSHVSAEARLLIRHYQRTSKELAAERETRRQWGRLFIVPHPSALGVSEVEGAEADPEDHYPLLAFMWRHPELQKTVGRQILASHSVLSEVPAKNQKKEECLVM